MQSTSRARVLVVDSDMQRAEAVRRCLEGEFDLVKATPSSVFHVNDESFDLLIEENVSTESLMDPLCSAGEELCRMLADSSETALLVGEKGSGRFLATTRAHRIRNPKGRVVRIDLGMPSWEHQLAGLEVDDLAYLDGIGALGHDAQERLLDRVGSFLPRVIFASSLAMRHLSPVLAARLAGATYSLRPLRERGDDIAFLATAFARLACHRLHRGQVRLSRSAMASLLSYDWPGNTIELRNVVTAAVEACRGDVVEADDLEVPKGPRFVGGLTEQVVDVVLSSAAGLDVAMAELESAVIRRALEEEGGNRSAAARRLKLPRQTLQDRMKKHGLWPK